MTGLRWVVLLLIQLGVSHVVAVGCSWGWKLLDVHLGWLGLSPSPRNVKVSPLHVVTLHGLSSKAAGLLTGGAEVPKNSRADAAMPSWGLGLDWHSSTAAAFYWLKRVTT